MKDFPLAAAQTTSSPRFTGIGVSMLGMVAFFSAAAAASTPIRAEKRSFSRVCCSDAESSTAVVKIEEAISSSSHAPREIQFQAVGESLTDFLKQNGLTPTRKTSTADGSMLMQFLGAGHACVDVYPNGDLIVMIRTGEVDEIHELTWQDSDRIVALLKDAGVAA